MFDNVTVLFLERKGDCSTQVWLYELIYSHKMTSLLYLVCHPGEGFCSTDRETHFNSLYSILCNRAVALWPS